MEFRSVVFRLVVWGLDVGGGLVAASQIITKSAAATTSILSFSTGTSSFCGTIQNGTGTTALTVASGSLTLTGINTYTGATSVNAGGTFTVAVGGDIAPTTALVANGTVNFNNAARTIASLNSTTAGTINLNT